VIKLLLEEGADLESKDDKFGWTPLLQAEENRYKAVIKLLLEISTKSLQLIARKNSVLIIDNACFHRTKVRVVTLIIFLMSHFMI
jgi:ankyrin repeat protein